MRYFLKLKLLFLSLWTLADSLLIRGNTNHAVYHQSTSRTKLSASPNAASAMIRKGKMKEVEAILKEIETVGEMHSIQKFIKDRTIDERIGIPLNFYNSTVNRFKSVSVMPEYSKKIKTGFILGMPEPEIMGGIYRDAGAKAIVVCLDKRSGGASSDEFARFVREQHRARAMVPTPIPVLWNDHIVHKVQIAHAGSLGASAVTLNPEMTDDLKEQVDYCKELGIEPIVMVKDLEEAQLAISSGARGLCLHLLDENELIDLRSRLPSATSNGDQGLFYIARLRAAAEFSSYSEIDLSWVLRDNGFNCVWPTPDALYATGFIDIYAIILAMKSKAGRQFISPRQFMMDRKKEGATEYLGDILY